MNPKYSITHTTYIYIYIIYDIMSNNRLWNHFLHHKTRYALATLLAEKWTEWMKVYVFPTINGNFPASCASSPESGVIQLPIWGGIKHYKCTVILRKFAKTKKCIVWVVYIMTPESVSFSACLMLWWYSPLQVFGMASGHINPSLPLARRLVSEGHKVRVIQTSVHVFFVWNMLAK